MPESLGELGSVISKLSENPEMLSMLMNIMKNMQPKKEEKPPPKEPDISGLLSLLGIGKQEEKCESEPKKPSGSFGTKEEMKKRIALLNAVRPYLSEERRDKLESVIKLLRLTELGELGSLLSKA